MTTEDNGFFKHRGWVSSEFKSALRRNLEGGGFRLGASSITMQMVKNVLLTKDKTLSRKLQELFLVWYLEQVLPKERILELYFNAIEFGPRIYGIGAGGAPLLRQEGLGADAARGGVLLVDPAVSEAALRPVLPRVAVAAVGEVHPPHPGQGARARADHRRGVRPLGRASRWCSTARRPRFTEKQCLEWVKSMAPKPEPETPPELDEGDADARQGDWPPRSCGACSRTRRRRAHARHRRPRKQRGRPRPLTQPAPGAVR